MTILVCVLIISIAIVLIKLNKLAGNLKQKEEQYNNIQKKYKQSIGDIDIYLNLIDELTKSNNQKDSEIEILKKKLDFYLNIEEDSAKLNEKDDSEEQKKLIEEAKNQIISDRTKNQNVNLGTEYETNLVLDNVQMKACDNMENTNYNFFITGKAGTGKSFLLDVFRKTTNKNYIVLAPTGIAALNVGGITIHSAFGYDNLVNLNLENINEYTIRLKEEKLIILRQVQTIIIDEVSMVRADTFDKIDKILKIINKSSLPFGGKQIIIVGDLFQLPPIAQKDEIKFLNDKYGGIYFFLSDSFKKGNFNFIELTINHRQKDDLAFFEILNHIRNGQISDSDIEILNKRVVTDVSAYDRFITLLPTKDAAKKVNNERLLALEPPEYIYSAQVVFDKYKNKVYNLESVFPITSKLKLRKGALIMMVANDSNHRWVNGTLGIVKSLSERSIFVSIDKYTYEIHPTEFTQQEAIYKNGKILYEDILKVVQYPLVLAYAITIHKSQGQTYKNIICDINRCFASGQAYVALSRCSSLNGLHLRGNINRASIQVDSNVLNFYHSQLTNKNNGLT